MRRFVTLFGVGALALAVQAGLATVLAPPWCPDLGLLVVVAIGLVREPATLGFVLAVSLGYTADLGSGSLLGQHALLQLLLFSASRLASAQLNLAGDFALAAFSFGATLVYGAAVGLSGAFFGAVGGTPSLLAFVAHAFVNALCAPVVARVVLGAAGWGGTDEGGRRVLRFQAGAFLP